VNDKELTARLTSIQQEYWRFDQKEKSELIKRSPLDLPWPEMMRLNHLCCLEIIQSKPAQRYLKDPDACPRVLPGRGKDSKYPGLDLDFFPELLQKLSSQGSPYRPRPCAVWQGKAPDTSSCEPQLMGSLRNASYTHFGSLEVINVDADGQPSDVVFVGFDEVSHIIFGRPALFRAAKLIYDDDREDEIVWMPLLYGISWMSSSSFDKDGSFTRFIEQQEILIDGEEQIIGMGIGHQDFLIDKKQGSQERNLFGLGSINELSVALDVEDPKFDQKCRARGLTEEDVWKIIKGS
jgi:hypothetical protein